MARLLLRFDNLKINDPLTARVILEEKILLNIASAHIDQTGGEILIDVDQEHLERVKNAFKNKGVRVTNPHIIEINDSKCISCEACVSLCPITALTYGSNNVVELDETKCNGITCGLCVDACPVKALRILSG